jgi:hypothetical protein
MKRIKFVGLDVHAETIAVAVKEPQGCQTGPRHYSLTTCASQIDPLGIREYVEGLSDPGNS